MTRRDRDVLVPKHRAPSPAVEFIDEECTGKYDGPELLAAREERAARNPARQIALIETEQKEQAKDIATIKLAVADIRGDQKAQNASLTAINTTLNRMAEREQVRYAAKETIEAAKATDVIAAGADRRKFWLTVAASILTGGALGKLLHWLGVF